MYVNLELERDITYEDPLYPPHPFLNENPSLYLERADVTSGLSREPITVGVGLCDSLTNLGLLQ